MQVDPSTLSKHGICECADGVLFGPGGCCGGKGPVAYEVVRHGAPLRICSRCRIPWKDSETRLLLTGDEDFETYFNHDPLEIMTLGFKLAAETAETTADG